MFTLILLVLWIFSVITGVMMTFRCRRAWTGFFLAAIGGPLGLIWCLIVRHDAEMEESAANVRAILAEIRKTRQVL